MPVVFPDGYVLEALGLHLSDRKNNDAGMIKLSSWIIVLVTALMTWNKLMQTTSKKDSFQHFKMEEANDSCVITKVRLVVESYQWQGRPPDK